MFGFSMAHWVMVFIAISGFSTVVFVLYFGTREDEHRPVSATDSQTTMIWIERANAKHASMAAAAEEADAEEEPTEES